MFPALSIDSTYIPYLRHPTKNKQLTVLAKIDGNNWYDISKYVKAVQISNKLEFLESPAIDSASIRVANLDNEWTPTQFNDTFDPANGKFNGTIDQAYLEKEWEVKIFVRVYKDATNHIDVPLFYGVKTGLTEEHKEATLKLADRLYWATKKKLEHDVLYVDMKPNNILSDLLQKVGYDSSIFDFQDVQYTCTFLAKKDSTIWQAVIQLVRGTAGKISTSPDGKILFRTRMDSTSYSDPAVALSLEQDTFSKYDLSTQRRYNKVVVTSNGYSVDSDTSKVVDFELDGDQRIILATKSGNFELEYISNYAIDVSNTIYIKYDTGTYDSTNGFVATGVDHEFYATVDTSNLTPDDGTIKITKYERYADKVVIEIQNLQTSSGSAVAIKHVSIEGKQVKHVSTNKVVRENTTGEPDKEYSVESFFDSEAVLNNIADIVYDDINKRVNFGLSLNYFYPDVYAGNLIKFSVPDKGISDGTFIVLKVEHNLQNSVYNTSFEVLEWKGLEYEVGDKTFTRATRSPDPINNQTQQQISETQGQIQELQEQVSQIDDRTNYIDGQSPSVPTNLTLATAVNDKGESVVRISFDASPEQDVTGYEVAYSIDGVHWRNVVISGIYTEVVVPGNTTVYVKVRALDAEGLKSDWTSTASITSAKDTTPPAVPTGLTATGLFQTIMVKWNENTDSDLDHYLMQYDTNSSFSTAKTLISRSNSIVIKDLDVNKTYYIRVAAVDKSGNSSAWSSAVSASTAKIDDENYYDYAAIKNAIIHNGYIDSAWISQLDAGLIKTGYLDADRIATHSLSLDKLVVTPSMGLPEGTVAYWCTSLVDEIGQITPAGYNITLSPILTLTPDNAPPGSIVGDFIAGNKIYAGNELQVGDSVFIQTTSTGDGKIIVKDGTEEVIKIGEKVTSDNQNGIFIKKGVIESESFNIDMNSGLMMASGIIGASFDEGLIYPSGGAFISWYTGVVSWQTFGGLFMGAVGTIAKDNIDYKKVLLPEGITMLPSHISVNHQAPADFAMAWQWWLGYKTLKVIRTLLDKLNNNANITVNIKVVFSDDTTYVSCYDQTSDSMILDVNTGGYSTSTFDWSCTISDVTHDYLLAVKTTNNAAGNFGVHLYWWMEAQE